VKVVFEAENSTLDLCRILNLIATLRKSVAVNSSVTLALLPGKINIVRICSPFLPLLHSILQRLHHMLMSSVYFLCAMICVQATVTE